MAYYGQSNSGPRAEVWTIGDVVIFGLRGDDYGQRGRVATPRREPDASETSYVWVEWADGTFGYLSPNSLDLDRRRAQKGGGR